MDIHAMIRHYRTIFKDDKDVIDWIEHDFAHMGLNDKEMKENINKLYAILNVGQKRE